MLPEPYLHAGVEARRAQLRATAGPRPETDGRGAVLTRLHLRLWWATRPRARRLHCFVTADDGLSVLGPGRFG